MAETEFFGFLSAVAGRLRHDLKGGLISLRMGLEALSDGEELKPLLIDRARQLEILSDKLILLLRMGEMRPEPIRLSALLAELRRRLSDRCSRIELTTTGDFMDLRTSLDGDALLEAMLEIAENAELAGAERLELSATWNTESGLLLCFHDNGGGADPGDSESDLTSLLPKLGVSRWGRDGLGLAIAERCAVGHGGCLSIERSSPGLRVCLTLVVPRS